MKIIVGYLKVKKDQSALAGGATSVIPVTTAPPAKTVPAEVVTPPVVTAEEKKTVALPKEDREVMKTTPPPDKTTAVNKPVTPPARTNTVDGEGYFKSIYENGGRRASGTAGIFKSRSGWDDGKYYALMNDMPIGTVVKVTNPSTNKIVYAKVLGQLPDMKESAGLTLRISDAAASILGVGESKFSVVVN